MAKRLTTQCPNGHFYDTEQYASCPYCGSGNGNFPGGDDATMPFFDQTRGDGGFPMDNDVTQGFSGGWMTGASPMGGNVTQDFNSWGPTEPVNPPQSRNTASAPVQNNVIEDDKTRPFFWTQEETKKETPAQKQYYPVVGWLVCTEGSNYGKSFELKAGKNFVGRSTEMDICLAGDESISRVKHAIITYEPKAKRFFAQPGESHELFYVNDDVVLTSVELHDRDVVSIGSTNMVFVPFCDDRFGWEKK